MAIQNLPSINTIAGGDQVALFSQALGGDAKAPVSLLPGLMGIPTGILSMSGFYVMRKVPTSPPANINIGTSYANFTAYDVPPLIFPEGRASFAPMVATGEFVAQRDIQAAMFWAAMTGTWPNTRDLTLSILVGSDASPSETSFQFVGAGRGGGNLSTASLSAPIVNLNNPGGVIRSGEKVRLVAKMNTADILGLHRLSFIVSTLDGV